MGFSLNSIPNSSGVTTVVNLFSSCHTFLKNARPLSHIGSELSSEKAPMVTSIIAIKPHEEIPLPSRLSPLLIVAGAAAILAGAYLIATRIIPYFFSSPKTPPPNNLSSRATVIPPPVDPDNGAGVRLLPSSSSTGRPEGKESPLPTAVPEQKVENHPPGPPSRTPSPSLQRVPTPPPVVSVPEKEDQPAKPLPRTPSPSPHISPTPPPAVSIQENEDQPTSPPLRTPSPPSPRVPSPTPALSAAEKEAPVSDEFVPSLEPIPSNIVPVSSIAAPLPLSPPSSPLPNSPSVSPPSSSPDSAAYSSESSSPVNDLSPSSSPNLQPTMLQRIGKVISYYVFNERHFSKWKKYRIIQDRLELFARQEKVQFYTNAADDSQAVIEITTAWNHLVKALLQPTTFDTADEQYRTTVECLRMTVQLLLSTDKEVKQKFASQLQFARELSYMRFAGIELFPYCRELIELATNTPLPASLTMDNFQEELTSRAAALNRPEQVHGMNGVACQVNKAKGALNINFDPLLKTSNVPYIDGRLTMNDRSILILRHGVPVTHHDPYGLMFDLVAGALSYIPFVKNLIPKNNPVSSPPVINADYVAFIEEAERKGQNILHVILENGNKKRVGNEEPRVVARLKLGVHHKNFFPLALRLDGEFFERHGFSEKQNESLQALKSRFKGQLLMPLAAVEESMTASQIHASQSEDQLSATGFCIPKEIREASQLENHIDTLLNEVQNIYFPGVENISSVQQHQAFLILSYVHIILFICHRLNITILEALCKDDKDRGNVIKTILKLHFLYITNQINHETLTSVLVNTLAAPFILQKNAIIKSRLILLKRVIPFIKEARDRMPIPKTIVFGAAVQNASYTVFTPPGQTIYPSNLAAKNIEEYLAFLNHHKPFQIPEYTGNLINEMAQEFYPENQRQDENIQQKISSAAKNMNIWTNERLLKIQPDSSLEQEANYYSKGAHESILAFLRVIPGLSLDDAWKVSCSVHQGLGAKLHSHLNEVFANQLLGISVKLDEEALNTPLCGIHLTGGNQIAQLTFNAVFNITHRDAAIARIKASVTIPDHQIGHAQFEYSFDKI